MNRVSPDYHDRQDPFGRHSARRHWSPCREHAPLINLRSPERGHHSGRSVMSARGSAISRRCSLNFLDMSGRRVLSKSARFWSIEAQDCEKPLSGMVRIQFLPVLNPWSLPALQSSDQSSRIQQPAEAGASRSKAIRAAPMGSIAAVLRLRHPPADDENGVATRAP